jgi:hypothetical protein
VRVEVHPLAPAGWVPAWHRTELAHLPHRSPVRWAHGVFIYSPPAPRQEVVVVEQGSRAPAPDPRRAVDRGNTLAVGLKGGALLMPADALSPDPDPGVGLMLRYRPVEALGLELSWMQHSGVEALTGGAAPTASPLSVSAQVFALPWTRVSPYLTLGGSWTRVQDPATEAGARASGLHGGVGLHLALGERAAVEAEVRGLQLGGVELPVGLSPWTAQATVGLVTHF